MFYYLEHARLQLWFFSPNLCAAFLVITLLLTVGGFRRMRMAHTPGIRMAAWSVAAMAGLQAEKGNFAIGLNYGIQASRHETDQGLRLTLGWKF